jgi:hypothetical protein
MKRGARIEALEELTGSGVWISRAVEVAKSRPVEFVEGPNPAATLRTWPEEHIVKCNLYMHPGDDAEIKELQEWRVLQLYDACIRNDRLLLLEVQATRGTSYDDNSMVELLERFYEIGVRPDWWKLPPNKEPEVWRRIGDVVREHDPYCAGVLVLGQAAEEEKLVESFAAAASEPLCNGFAIGRSIYGDAARRWLGGDRRRVPAISPGLPGIDTVIEPRPRECPSSSWTPLISSPTNFAANDGMPLAACTWSTVTRLPATVTVRRSTCWASHTRSRNAGVISMAETSSGDAS